MGRIPCSEKTGLKRGKWTSEEDEILINYIKANGDGSWRSLPQNAGLLRCGKSCRLRWINYLRDDLKRGNFTRDEDETIVKLHNTLGKKWSVIASYLPGRTDNEIKNYWNSHLSRIIYQFRSTVNSPLASLDTIKVAESSKRRKGRVSRRLAKKYNSKTRFMTKMKIKGKETKEVGVNHFSNANESNLPELDVHERDGNPKSLNENGSISSCDLLGSEKWPSAFMTLMEDVSDECTSGPLEDLSENSLIQLKEFEELISAGTDRVTMDEESLDASDERYCKAWSSNSETGNLYECYNCPMVSYFDNKTDECSFEELEDLSEISLIQSKEFEDLISAGTDRVTMDEESLDASDERYCKAWSSNSETGNLYECYNCPMVSYFDNKTDECSFGELEDLSEISLIQSKEFEDLISAGTDKVIMYDESLDTRDERYCNAWSSNLETGNMYECYNSPIVSYFDKEIDERTFGPLEDLSENSLIQLKEFEDLISVGTDKVTMDEESLDASDESYCKAWSSNSETGKLYECYNSPIVSYFDNKTVECTFEPLEDLSENSLIQLKEFEELISVGTDKVTMDEESLDASDESYRKVWSSNSETGNLYECYNSPIVSYFVNDEFRGEVDAAGNTEVGFWSENEDMLIWS